MQPLSKKRVIEMESFLRFIPLGDSHVRDLTTFGEHPVDHCKIKSVYPSKHVYAALLENADIEILFRIDAAYSIFLTDPEREHGIVLSYDKVMEGLNYLTPTVRAIQLSFDPALYIECVPIDTP